MNSKMVIGAFIAFLMVASIFGATLDYFASQRSLEYNDIDFIPIGAQFRAEVNDKDYVFNFFPADLEYLSLNDTIKTLLEQPVMAVTYDPTSNLTEAMAGAQYYLEQQLMDVKVIELALANNTGTALSQKTCKDATVQQPVIEFRHANESSITAKGNCLTLNALDAYDLYQQTERILYEMLGVIR